MIERYQRQLRFPQFGEAGQRQLMAMHVMVVGVGALGSHVAEMLVRMGIGKLTIIDMDIVELSNLHRQSLYDEQDADQVLPKVVALERHLQCINSSVTVESYDCELTSKNIEDILQAAQPHVVIDGMDHFRIRYMINEVCHKQQIPWIYGAAVGSKGTVYGIDFQGPCLKCLLATMPDTAESCAINGVLPPVVTQIASMQVSELLRYAAGVGFSGKLITVDTFEIKHQAMNVAVLSDNNCPVCKHQRYELLNKPMQQRIEALCGNTYLFRFASATFNNAQYLPGQLIKENPFAKIFSYDQVHCTLFRDGRMNVYGLSDDIEAQQLYNQFNKALK